MRFERIIDGKDHLWAVRDMNKHVHTQEELTKLNQCRQFLIDNGVFDSDSFISMIEED
jgi:hypothetical protein